MFKTPITRLSANHVDQQKESAQVSLARAKSARAAFSRGQLALTEKPENAVIWSFAVGLIMGSRRKVTKIVERPTKTINNSTSFLSIASALLSVLALRYRTKILFGRHSGVKTTEIDK